MGREVKRVPLDFDAPLDEVWHGYLMPDRLHGNDCPDCKNGYSPRAEFLFDLWYGNAPFRPTKRLRPDTPAVREFAERNVTRSPDYYGTGEAVIRREAQRLATLWNGQLCHHLRQADVDALVEAGRLMDITHTWVPGDGWQKIEPPVAPTAEQVNEWSLRGLGHDSINASVVIGARCEREGVSDICATCGGHASVEAYPGQRAEAEAWEATEPPEGEGWQLWTTVTEGSPMSPVCASAEDLAAWMSRNPCLPAGESPTFQTAMAFIAKGWAPSFVGRGGVLMDGVTVSADSSP
jgi:hypothetical protein